MARPAAGDNGVGASAHDGLAGVENRIGGTGASCRDHVAGAAKLIRHGDFAAQRSDRGRRYGVDARFSRLTAETSAHIAVR